MMFSTRYLVPKDLECFAGHFPGNPLVPGALLLAWVAKQFGSGCEGSLLVIKSAKFIQAVRPGAILVFEFSVEQERHTVKFSVFIETELPASLAANGVGTYSEVSS